MSQRSVSSERSAGEVESNDRPCPNRTLNARFGFYRFLSACWYDHDETRQGESGESGDAPREGPRQLEDFREAYRVCDRRHLIRVRVIVDISSWADLTDTGVMVKLAGYCRVVGDEDENVAVGPVRVNRERQVATMICKNERLAQEFAAYLEERTGLTVTVKNISVHSI